MTALYPAPGGRPIVQVVDVPGAPPGWHTITCWCRTMRVTYTAGNAARIAAEHYRTHRWVNRWPRLLGRWAWLVEGRP